jgi:hypothetical protein
VTAASVCNIASGLETFLLLTEKICWTFLSDEAWFAFIRLRQLPKQQLVVDPRDIMETPLHDPKVGVWCARSRNRMTGPIFFEDTINFECYCELILYTFIDHSNEDDVSRGYFQQDGATVHVSTTLLRSVFGERLI